VKITVTPGGKLQTLANERQPGAWPSLLQGGKTVFATSWPMLSVLWSDTALTPMPGGRGDSMATFIKPTRPQPEAPPASIGVPWIAAAWTSMDGGLSIIPVNAEEKTGNDWMETLPEKTGHPGASQAVGAPLPLGRLRCSLRQGIWRTHHHRL